MALIRISGGSGVAITKTTKTEAVTRADSKWSVTIDLSDVAYEKITAVKAALTSQTTETGTFLGAFSDAQVVDGISTGALTSWSVTVGVKSVTIEATGSSAYDGATGSYAIDIYTV